MGQRIETTNRGSKTPQSAMRRIRDRYENRIFCFVCPFVHRFPSLHGIRTSVTPFGLQVTQRGTGETSSCSLKNDKSRRARWLAVQNANRSASVKTPFADIDIKTQTPGFSTGDNLPIARISKTSMALLLLRARAAMLSARVTRAALRFQRACIPVVFRGAVSDEAVFATVGLSRFREVPAICPQFLVAWAYIAVSHRVIDKVFT